MSGRGGRGRGRGSVGGFSEYCFNFKEEVVEEERDVAEVMVVEEETAHKEVDFVEGDLELNPMLQPQVFKLVHRVSRKTS